MGQARVAYADEDPPPAKKKVEEAINLEMYRKGWRDFCWSNSFVGLEGANLCVNTIADDDGFIGRKGGKNLLHHRLCKYLGRRKNKSFSVSATVVTTIPEVEK